MEYLYYYCVIVIVIVFIVGYFIGVHNERKYGPSACQKILDQERQRPTEEVQMRLDILSRVAKLQEITN